LAQEIVVQLWRSYPRFDERKSFSTWMYRVAMNVAISFSRRETRRTRDRLPDGATVLETIAAPSGEQPDERLEALRRLIGGLEGLDRALVILYFDGRSHAEIAEILGISESNVGTKISRIKQRLKRDAAAGGSL
jgi:RNA polymerase sigma-70 factor (ECF subfamily)